MWRMPALRKYGVCNMSVFRFTTVGNTLSIKCVRQYNAKGVTGLTVNLTIQRSSDNGYWTGETWGALTVLTMTEVSSVNNPGEYSYTGPVAAASEIYECHAYVTSGQYAFDGYETIAAQISTDSIKSDTSGIKTVTDQELAQFSQVITLIAGKHTVAADGKTIQYFKPNGDLFATAVRTGTGMKTWTTTWA